MAGSITASGIASHRIDVVSNLLPPPISKSKKNPTSVFCPAPKSVIIE
jgi:hypothetical protein